MFCRGKHAKPIRVVGAILGEEGEDRLRYILWIVMNVLSIRNQMLMTSWWAGIDRFPPQLAAEVYFHVDMAETAFTPPQLWRSRGRTGDD